MITQNNILNKLIIYLQTKLIRRRANMRQRDLLIKLRSFVDDVNWLISVFFNMASSRGMNQRPFHT